MYDIVVYEDDHVWCFKFNESNDGKRSSCQTCDLKPKMSGSYDKCKFMHIGCPARHYFKSKCTGTSEEYLNIIVANVIEMINNMEAAHG